MKNKITINDLIKYYIFKQTRKENLNINEQFNEENYWQKIIYHRHTFIVTENFKDEISPKEHRAIECLGCPLSNRYFRFQDDFSLMMQALYDDALNKHNYEFLSDKILNYDDMKSLYEYYKGTKNQHIGQSLKLSIANISNKKDRK